MISEDLLNRLKRIQIQYCWTIGSTIICDFECSIWERGKWRDKDRICIRGTGKTYEEAVIEAFKILETRDSNVINSA